MTNLENNEIETVTIPTEVSDNFDPKTMDDLSSSTSDTPVLSNDDNEDEESFGSEFEDELTKKMVENTKNQEVEQTKKRGSQKKESVIHDNIGLETDPNAKKITEYVTPAQQEEQDWYDLKNLARSKGIVWGKITGVQKGYDNLNDAIYATVSMPKYPNMQVLINEKDYWMDNQNFGNSYAGLNDKAKETRRMNALSYQLGARIPFFIKNLARRKVKDNGYDEFQTPYKYMIIGDRVSAMLYLQKCWFFRESTPFNTTDAYGANVLQVMDEAVKVECCGVESYITAYELSGKKYVQNCKEVCKAGDKIPVRVMKFHTHKKGEPYASNRKGDNKGKVYERDTVYLSVSRRLFDNGFTPKNLASMTIGGIYLGYVRSYNKTNGVYSINLANGVVASVQAGKVTGGVALDIGDQVYFHLEEKLGSYVRGRCMRV